MDSNANCSGVADVKAASQDWIKLVIASFAPEFTFAGLFTLTVIVAVVLASYNATRLGEMVTLSCVGEDASLGSTQIYTQVDAARLLETYRTAHPRDRD